MKRKIGDLGEYTYSAEQLILLQTEKDGARNPCFTQVYQTGFRKIDHQIGGFKAGDLVVVAAPPAIGKRPFVLSLIAGLKSTNNESDLAICYFSLDLNAQQLFGQLLSNLSASVLRKGHENPSSLQAEYAVHNVVKTTMRKDVFDEERNLDLIDLLGKIRHNQRATKSTVFVVDYIQRLKHNSGSREVMNLCLKGLKAIAEEYGIVVIVLSRVSRSIEKDPKRKPSFKYLNELGNFKRFSDHIFLLHRPEFYGFIPSNTAKSKKGVLKIIGWRKDHNKKYILALQFHAPSFSVWE